MENNRFENFDLPKFKPFIIIEATPAQVKINGSPGLRAREEYNGNPDLRTREEENGNRPHGQFHLKLLGCAIDNSAPLEKETFP